MNESSSRPLRLTPAALRQSKSSMDLVLSARERERAGAIPEAIEQYEAAMAQAEAGGESAVLSEALRRLARVRHERGERDEAWSLCISAYDIASQARSDLLAGEALNTQGVMRVREGSLSQARDA